MPEQHLQTRTWRNNYFFSTKKKHKSLKKIRFAKPTSDEKEQFLDDYRGKSKFFSHHLSLKLDGYFSN